MWRRFSLSLLTSLLVILSLTTGCEKRRKERFTQGNGEYVYALADFKGATYTLKTGKKRTPGVTTRADLLVAAPGNSVIRSFDSVESELDTDLGEFSNETLNNFDFYGKENSEYKIQMDFTESNLVLFKLAARDEIPSNELTYAEQVGADTYRVPLFGLPLSKYTIERVQDSRGKSTNIVSTFAKEFLADATHFKADVKAPKYFSASAKLDLFPAKFFDENNQWFYEIVVVDKPIGLDASGLEIGYQLGEGRVKFAKTNNSILAVDVNIAEEAAGQDAEKLNVVLELPVSWTDYRLVKGGSDALLKEEAFNDTASGAKFWKDREYALLKLDRVLDVTSANTGNIKIRRLEVADDYVSFVVYDSVSKIALSFSFAKENRVVEGKVYPREDKKKFGFFESRRDLFNGSLNLSEQAVSKSYVQNRMYPKDGVIRFHVTEETPNDPLFHESIRAAVDGWNWAFAEAAKGTKYENNPIRVVLEDQIPVKNGDVRYHKVAFYGYEFQSGLLGYGPSVSDSRNGEIFSSTNHIYLRNYRESIIRNLVNYIRYQLGVYEGLELDGITVPNQVLATDSNQGFNFNQKATVNVARQTYGMFDAMPAITSEYSEPALDWDKLTKISVADSSRKIIERARSASEDQNTQEAGKSDLFGKFLAARRQLVAGTVDDKGFQSLIVNARKDDSGKGRTCEKLAATSLTFKEIEDVCGGKSSDLTQYIEELKLANADKKGMMTLRLDSEREVLLACAQKLMKPTLISTLLHEFGHNFGLRHNFQGSGDADNFPKGADGKTPKFRTASVMDYANADADRGDAPSTYDVAAIRYGYYNAVEVVGPGGKVEIVDVSGKPDDTRSAEKRVKVQKGDQYNLKPYAFCTDDDIPGYPSAQVPTETPFCERWDQGADPVTKVRAAIDGLITFVTTSGNRFDMEFSATPARLASASIERYMGGLKNVYDKYRFDLYNTSKAVSAKAGELRDDPYFDDRTQNETEAAVFGAELQKVKDFLSLIKANPQMPAIQVEQAMKGFSKLAQYKIASELAKNFFIELIFAQSAYCVALTDNGAAMEVLDVEPLATVRTKSYFINGLDTTSCDGTAAYFTQKLSSTLGGRRVDAVLSAGNPFDSVPLSSNPDLLPLRANVRTGLSGLRNLALGYLSGRTGVGQSIIASYVEDEGAFVPVVTGLRVAARAGFLPSMLDDESFRTEFLRRLENRLVSGVNVDELARYADSRQKRTNGKPVVAGSFANRALPFYQEEKNFLATAWNVYRIGVLSPRATTGAKSASTQIQALPFVNFIGFGGDQRYQEYLVSTDGTAFFTNGSTAVSLIRTFNETESVSRALKEKKDLFSNPTLSAANTARFNEKVAGVVAGYLTAIAQLDDRYGTLNDVLYQVRVCTLNTLVKEYGLSKVNFTSLMLESNADSRFSIPKYCEGVRTEADASLTKFEGEYLAKARTYLDYVKSDRKALNVNMLESVLTLVGLPESPDEAEDPEVTLERIFKSQQRLPAQFANADSVGKPLTSLEYKVVLAATTSLQKSLQGNQLTGVSILSAVEEARKSVLASLEKDEPFAGLLNDKLEILRNLIFD